MEIKIIREFQNFEKLKGEWDEALNRSRFNVFFLTFDWLSTWWQYFGAGHDLFLILIRKDGRLLAAAPLMIKKIKLGKIVVSRKLQFITSGSSDYMDFLVVDKEKECFSLIFEKIKEHSHLWDWAEFIYIPENSKNISLWLNYWNSQWLVLKEIRSSSIVIDLTQYSCWEEYFGGLDKKFRGDTKRQENNLKNFGEISLQIFTDYDKISSIISDFFQLHQERWNKKGLRSKFQDERVKSRYLSLARDLSGTGRVEVSCLKINEEIAALHFGFVYKYHYYYSTPVFNAKFKKFSPGRLLLANLIRDSFQRGLKKFDLLLGAERYKLSWSNNKVDLFGVFFFKKSLISQIVHLYNNKRRQLEFLKFPLLRYFKRKLTRIF